MVLVWLSGIEYRGRSMCDVELIVTLKPSPYRSEENIYCLEDEGGTTPSRVKSMYNMRPASSLMDLMSSFKRDDDIRYKVSN